MKANAGIFVVLVTAMTGVFAPVAAAAPVEDPAQAVRPAQGERGYTAHRAKGIVEKLDATGRHVTIKHGPVPSLNWSAGMTTFEVGGLVSLDGIRVGNEVDFEFTSSDKGGYRITTLSKSAAADGRAQLNTQLPRSTRIPRLAQSSSIRSSACTS